MMETYAPRVKHLSANAKPTVLRRSRAVHWIADDRVADVGHVNANLMGATSFDLDKEETPRVRCRQRAVSGPCEAAVHHSGAHFVSAARTTPDQSLDDTRGRLGVSIHQREIFFLDLARLELLGELSVGLFVFRNHQNSAGVAVKPVHNPRPQFTAHATQVRTMVKKGMNQRAGFVAGSGMNDQSRRLVENEQVRILKQNL